MKRGWKTGGFFLLGLMVAASPAAGGDWYGAFKPFIYSSNLDAVDQKPIPIASSGFLSEGPIPVADSSSNEVSIAGAELTIGRRLSGNSSAELTLKKIIAETPPVPSLIGSQNSRPTLLSGDLIIAIVMDGFRRSLPESMEYDTEFISAELSYSYRAAALWSFMGGFRYMYLGEELNQSSPGNYALRPKGLYGVESEVHYIGAQIGADFATSLREDIAISGEVKLGGFVNIAETTTLLYDNEGNSFTFKDSDTRIATLVEGNFSVDWRISPVMSLSAGYSAVFMGKISDDAQLAHDQIAAGFKHEDTDNVLFHGPILKFNLIW